jgi:hypothetical protein
LPFGAVDVPAIIGEAGVHVMPSVDVEKIIGLSPIVSVAPTEKQINLSPSCIIDHNIPEETPRVILSLELLDIAVQVDRSLE